MRAALIVCAVREAEADVAACRERVAVLERQVGTEPTLLMDRDRLRTRRRWLREAEDRLAAAKKRLAAAAAQEDEES